MGEMKTLLDLIQVIMKSIKSPVASIGAALAGLLLYFYVLVSKGRFRDRKADQEKDEQKGESNTTLENSNAEGEDSVRDQLERRTTVKDT